MFKKLPYNLLQPLFAGALLLSVSCAPSIYTSIRKSAPARSDEAAVLIYDTYDPTPEQTDTLGEFSIRDKGFAINCNYDQVMALAKRTVNRAGGNALHLTQHKEPNLFGSSCHQLWGDILLLPDSAFASTTVDNAVTQVTREIDQPLTPMEERTAKEFLRMEDLRKPTPFTIHIDPGYAVIGSKYIQPDGMQGDPKQGFNLAAAVQWTSRSGFGVGARYSGYFASAELPAEGGSGYEKFRLQLHYFAPELVLRNTLGRKWQLPIVLGGGYARYTEAARARYTLNGYGFHVGMGIEYKITPHIGVGASLGVYYLYFKEMKRLLEQMGVDTGNQKGGVSYYTLNGGLKFYF